MNLQIDPDYLSAIPRPASAVRRARRRFSAVTKSQPESAGHVEKKAVMEEKASLDEWSGKLVAVGVERDAAAFTALFDHFAPRLKSLLMGRLGLSPPVAEEVVQETFIMVWRKAASFDPSKSGASTWIFTIARNKRIDRLRRMGRPAPDMTDPVFEQDAPEEADGLLISSEREQRVRRAMESLPEAQREVLLRSYYLDETHAEIAANLKTPLGTVKSRLRLALEKLKSALESDMESGSL